MGTRKLIGKLLFISLLHCSNAVLYGLYNVDTAIRFLQDYPASFKAVEIYKALAKEMLRKHYIDKPPAYYST